MKQRIFYIIFFGFLLLAPAKAQVPVNYFVLPGKVVNGDTILMAAIQEVYVFPKKKFKNKREEIRYTKLIRDVKKAYPYAKLAREKLEELNQQFLVLRTEKEKKVFAKQVEEQLRQDYEEELKKLTITQGRLLIKLIDRETGNTSYNLVKELRGSFQAAFWQTVARLFGSNLKMRYDAKGADKDIEDIIHKIDQGYL